MEGNRIAPPYLASGSFSGAFNLIVVSGSIRHGPLSISPISATRYFALPKARCIFSAVWVIHRLRVNGPLIEAVGCEQ